MGKHIVDLDEHAPAGARVELGTTTIEDTVNQARHRIADDHGRRVSASLDVLAASGLDDSVDAWR